MPPSQSSRSRITSAAWEERSDDIAQPLDFQNRNDHPVARGRRRSVTTVTDPREKHVYDAVFGTEICQSELPMPYHATKQPVSNRGIPPDDFLDQLVAWGKTAPDDIFAPTPDADIYSNVLEVLGPWEGIRHRRAVMLEVMRVLAGFESSWDWNAGADVNNPTSTTPDTIEAGAWQVSADSMGFGEELRNLVLNTIGSLDGNDFQQAMKQDHKLAMEYIARLLRRTVDHNGPVKRHEIDPWLHKDAVMEFRNLLS
jgi:hypothetical protein